MTIAAAIAVVLAALYFTLGIRARDIPEPIPISPIQHLEDRKQAIYDNLRDLQFEYRLGKLSDGDYQQNKLALQRELAGVLAEIEETSQRLGLTRVRAAVNSQKQSVAASSGSLCAHCGATFPQSLKFCGNCGKAIA